MQPYDHRNSCDAPGTTFVGNTYNVGPRPAGVVSADVNGDSKPDIINVNNLANTLTVLTNNGSGSFGSNATFAVGGGPLAVVAADVNGDGKPDLISVNNLANTLTVLTNNGAGVFGANATLIVGSYPVFVAAADVNGDGKPDLISVNNSASTLTVLTNNGSGSFVFRATLPVGDRPYGVVAADVNGDGKLDLISANFNANTLTVLTNNGSGSFSFKATLTVGSGPYAVVATDVNGDGKPDLISANYDANTLTLLTNNGAGNFVFKATLAVNGYPDSVVAADMNGDGKPDLISANLSIYPNAGTVTVLTNNGSGSFGSNTVATVGLQPFCLAAVDVNSDGRPDLITANYGANTLTVLMQTAPPGPALTIANTGSNLVVISWPLPAIGFVLQTNANLGGTNWGTLGYPIKTNFTGSINFLPSANRLFFRLKMLTPTSGPGTTLTIAATRSNTVAISWPFPATGFVLQTNADSRGTNWGTAGYLITTNATASISILPSANRLFFRLKK